MQKIKIIERELNAKLLERSNHVRAALVALLAGEHLLFIGPPGTGKSYLVEQLHQHIDGASVFNWLLTKFSTPEELFGPVSVQALKQDQYLRITTNKLPESEIVFLDEIFKANSAILNALLTCLNERRFDNGSQRQSIPLVSLVGASNELPEDETLNALWDRFMLRLEVGPISDQNFIALLKLNGAAPPTKLTLVELQQLQQQRTQVVIDDSVLQSLLKLRKALQKEGITASDRRWRKSLALLQAHALIEGRQAVDEDDFDILTHVLWEAPEEIAAVRKAIGSLSNPLNARALELEDQAVTIHEATNKDKEESTAKFAEATLKLKKIREELRQIIAKARETGKSDKKILASGLKVKALHEELLGLYHQEMEF